MNALRRKANWMLPLLALLVATPAFAQGGGTAASLVGSVADPAGGVIPGATVEVKNNATGVTERLVTNSSGVFSVPSLNPGTYTVSVSLSGFKTHVLNDVRIIAATANEVKVTLQLGSLTETVEVSGEHGTRPDAEHDGAEHDDDRAVDQAPTRVAQRALGGDVSARASSRPAAIGPSTVNGLPQNTISITLDGIGIGNNLQSGDGFYAQVFPRMDAIEEVTVTGATPDAASGAQGSVQIAFATRSGSNRYDASVYHYYRTPALNTNYYFNEINSLPKNAITVHQYGGRVGGPIKPRQGVLLLQLRALPPAERGDAHPHDPAAAGHDRRVPLRRRRAGQRGQRARRRGAQRATRLDRSHGRPAADVHPQRRRDDRHDSDDDEPEHAVLHVPAAVGAQRVRADDARGLQPDAAGIG